MITNVTDRLFKMWQDRLVKKAQRYREANCCSYCGINMGREGAQHVSTCILAVNV